MDENTMKFVRKFREAFDAAHSVPGVEINWDLTFKGDKEARATLKAMIDFEMAESNLEFIRSNGKED